MDPLAQAPSWLLRPLPINAGVDPALHARLETLLQGLPTSLGALRDELTAVRAFREYDADANLVCAHIWHRLEACVASAEVRDRLAMLNFATDHFTEAALARLLRRVAKDPTAQVRRTMRRVLRKSRIREVALPAQPNGAWDQTGWLAGTNKGPLSRHQAGSRKRKQNDLPKISNLAELRELLGIRSPAQLGWMLLATDEGDGPYTRFTIPKRDGRERAICAPKQQLLWTQRRILEHILSKVPAHDAAHGFVAGRSTVTNARPHLKSKLLVKFDLRDFFPTIHYYRVLGLFARLGYTVDDARFGTADDSPRVAPTLARLCSYTPDPRAWHMGHCPQGAPTSPAISNLVCRRLDARLTGLAKRNAGVYTRYADDLTFSFPSGEIDLGRFRWWVDQVCQQEGFAVHQSKFRVIRASQRQVVTGIVVNDELRVPRDERRRFRAILHNCQTQGVASQARGRAGFPAWLRGYASYINMVHPEDGAELLRQVEELLGKEPEEPSP